VNPAAEALYAERILAQLQRVLGQLDREPLSPTAGCADRTYWAWKFVDFPAPRFQEAVCALAYAWATPLAGSPYHHDANLLAWIELALRWWASRQHRDGSFDEAYPFERSLAATSFTTFYVSEAVLLLGDALSPETRMIAEKAIGSAGRWLTRNDETHGFLSNHLAAALAACWHAYRVTGERAYEGRAHYFRDKILREQSSEGWYREYEGADPGYQTHGSFYLARYEELSGDASLANSLERSFVFLAHFVHPDGSLGGEYASRNTQTYYPAAFEMWAHRSHTAAWIAEAMRPSVASGAAAGIGAVDAWNQYPLLNNLVFAHRAAGDSARTSLAPREPDSSRSFKHFPEAGIVCVRRPRYEAVVATKKGGVIKVWSRASRRLAYSDCGWIGRTTQGALIATQWFDPARPIRVDPEAVEVDGEAVYVSRPTLTPFMFLGFRGFSLTIGRFPFAARWIKALLVHVLVYRKRSGGFSFARRIELGESGIRVVDRLRGKARLVELLRAARFATIHMGSSRYFVPNELRGIRDEAGAEDRAAPRELAAGIVRTRAHRLD
jgi:hypothetical protein